MIELLAKVVVHEKFFETQVFGAPTTTKERRLTASLGVTFTEARRKTVLYWSLETLWVYTQVPSTIPAVLEHFLVAWRTHLIISKGLQFNNVVP